MTTNLEEDDIFLEEVDGWDNDGEDELFFDDDDDDDDDDSNNNNDNHHKNTTMTESNNNTISPTAVANTTKSVSITPSITSNSSDTPSLKNNDDDNTNNNVSIVKENKAGYTVPTSTDRMLSPASRTSSQKDPVNENVNNNASSIITNTTTLHSSTQPTTTTPPKNQLRIPATISSVPLATLSSHHGTTTTTTPSTARPTFGGTDSAATTTSTLNHSATGGAPSIASPPNTPFLNHASSGTINNNSNKHETTPSTTATTPSNFALGSAVGLGSFWQRLAATAAPVPKVDDNVHSASSPLLSTSESQHPKQQDNSSSTQLASSTENSTTIGETQSDKLFHSPPQQQNQKQTTELRNDFNQPVVDQIRLDDTEDANNGWDNDFSWNTDGMEGSSGAILQGGSNRSEDIKEGVANQIGNGTSLNDNAWDNDFSFDEDGTGFQTDEKQQEMQQQSPTAETTNFAAALDVAEKTIPSIASDKHEKAIWNSEVSFNDEVVDTNSTNASKLTPQKSIIKQPNSGNNRNATDTIISNNNTPKVLFSFGKDQNPKSIDNKQKRSQQLESNGKYNDQPKSSYRVESSNNDDEVYGWNNDFSFTNEPTDNDKSWDRQSTVQQGRSETRLNTSIDKSKSSVSGFNEWDSSYFLDEPTADASADEQIDFFAGIGDTPSSKPAITDDLQPSSFSGMIQQLSSSQSLVFNDWSDYPQHNPKQEQPCSEQEIAIPPMDHVNHFVLDNEQTQYQSNNRILLLQRQLHEAQVELISLRALNKFSASDSSQTSEKVSVPSSALIDSTVLTTLQQHHQQHLQIEYDCLNKQSQKIRDLESANERLEEEKSQLTDEVIQYQQKTVPLLQNEILALSSERDVLKRNIDEVNQGLASFQSVFDDAERKHADKVSVLSGEIAELQSKVRQKEEQIFAMDVQFRQEGESARAMFDSERNHLLEQIRQSNNALQTYETETQVTLQSSNDRIHQQAQEIQSLHQVLTNMEHRLRQLLSRNNKNNGNEQERSEQSSGETTEGATVSKRNTTLIELFHRLDREVTQKDDEIQRLEDVIENMTFRQDDMGEDPMELRAELDAVIEEKRIMTEQIRNLDEQCKGLRSTVNSLTAAKSVSEEALAQQSEEAAQWRVALEKCSRDFQDQREQWDTAKAAELSKRSEEIKSLQASLGIKSDEKLRLLQQVESITREKDQLVQELQHVVNSRNAAEQAVQRLKDNTVEPLRRELQQVSANYEKVETERQQAVKHLAELNKECKRVEQQLAKYRNDAEKLEQNVATATIERDEALANCRSLTSRLSGLQVSYEQIQRDADFERSNHQVSIHELETKFQTLSKEYDKLLLLKSSFDEIQKASEKTILDLRQQLEDAAVSSERVIVQLQTERDQYVSKTKETSAKSIHRLQQEVDKLNKENEELYVQFAYLNANFEQTKEKLVEYIEGNTNLQAQLQEATSHSTELTSLAESLIEERDNLLGQVQQLQRTSREPTIPSDRTAVLDKSSTTGSSDEELRELQEKFKQQQNEVVALQKQLHEATRSSASSSSDEQQNKDRINQLESSCQRLQEELLALKSVPKSVDPVVKPKLISELEGRIVALVNEMDSLRNDLTITKQSLESKDNTIQKLTIDLQEAQAQQKRLIEEQKAKPVAAIGSENDVVSLREYVITLAQALEQSERKHAEAVERLASERLTHAEALKKLGQSLKQYYSRVTLMGEPNCAMNGYGSVSTTHSPNGTFH